MPRRSKTAGADVPPPRPRSGRHRPLSALGPPIWRHLTPFPRSPSWQWIGEHGRNDVGDERFDGARVPWCEGVCEAFDSGFYRRVVLQWAARQAKTTIRDNLLLRLAAVDPQRILLGGPTEEMVRHWIKDKLYPMADEVDPLKDRLPGKAKRAYKRIDFDGGYVQGVWAGSDIMLRDFSARYGFAGELDGWPAATEEEGDPVARFEKRLGSFPDHVLLAESTPTSKGNSRIEQLVALGTDSRFQVPCPHCGHFQELRFPELDWDTAKARTEGGLFWSAREDGSQHSGLAHDTAVYLCSACHGEICDQHKPAAVRSGVWVPRGCYVQHVEGAAQIAGTPAAGRTRTWSSVLSIMPSLDRSFGSIAAEWVEVHNSTKSGAKKAFINLSGGLPYEHNPVRTTADDLAARLTVAAERGSVPREHTFLTCFVDVQALWKLHALVWVVLSHGRDERAHLVHWGIAADWIEVTTILESPWTHADGGPALRIARTLVDSSDGQRTKEIYDFCRSCRRLGLDVVPAKGSSVHLGGQKYRISRIGEKKSRARTRASRSARGEQLVIIAVDLWEADIQQRLDHRRPHEPGCLSLPGEAAGDRELLKQLVNATYEPKPGTDGIELLLWRKRWEEEPNDYRDCVRGALCAAAYYLDERGGHAPPRATTPAAKCLADERAAKESAERRFVRPISNPRWRAKD